MSALVSGRCMSDADASAFYYSSVVPFLTPSGVQSVEWRSGSWSLVTLAPSGLETVQALGSPALYPCNPGDSVVLGVEYGFAVVAVWVVAFGFRALAKAV